MTSVNAHHHEFPMTAFSHVTELFSKLAPAESAAGVRGDSVTCLKTVFAERKASVRATHPAISEPSRGPSAWSARANSPRTAAEIGDGIHAANK